MLNSNDNSFNFKKRLSRRQLLTGMAVASGACVAGMNYFPRFFPPKFNIEPVFIAKAGSYDESIEKIILLGLSELGITKNEIMGKSVLLKPNLVEPHVSANHINTHPKVIAGAIEAFKILGAAEVLVGEGSGHRMDSLLILEMTGYIDMLRHFRTKFLDLNRGDIFLKNNLGNYTAMKKLVFSKELKRIDIIVSMAKMKTHHWVGATLSMKNLFGIMPGSCYGWPKNVLHFAGIEESILDINATIKPQLAIVDGIVGMEGDGPIMGQPVDAKVLVMGKNLPAVDATCSRIMGLNPFKIKYLKASEKILGQIREEKIEQIGEIIKSVKKNFALIEKIPSHKGLRLGLKENEKN
jgi:uncharacterized protein (DUF362 family)